MFKSISTIMLTLIFAIIATGQTNKFSNLQGMNTELPSGVSEKELIHLLLPNDNANLAILAGMRRWKNGGTNTYIAISSTAPNQKAYNNILRVSDSARIVPGNFYDDAHGLHVGMAVVTYTPESGINVTAQTDWYTSQTNPFWENAFAKLDQNLLNTLSEAEYYKYLDAQGLSEKETDKPYLYLNFDLANFKMSSNVTSFGIRNVHYKTYSGGGAQYEYLVLFAIIEGDLIPVFKSCMSEYEDIAGNWNDDGTRDHDISESNYILMVDTKQTNGYNNFIIKERKTQNKTVYRWNSAKKYYLAE